MAKEEFDEYINLNSWEPQEVPKELDAGWVTENDLWNITITENEAFAPDSFEFQINPEVIAAQERFDQHKEQFSTIQQEIMDVATTIVQEDNITIEAEATDENQPSLEELTAQITNEIAKMVANEQEVNANSKDDDNDNDYPPENSSKETNNGVSKHENNANELEKYKEAWNRQVEIMNHNWERKYNSLLAQNNYHRTVIGEQNETITKMADEHQSTIDKLQLEKDEATELFTSEVTKNIDNEKEIKEVKLHYKTIEEESASLRNENTRLKDEITNLKIEIEKIRQEFQDYQQTVIKTPVLETEPKRKRKSNEIQQDPKYQRIKNKLRKIIKKKGSNQTNKS